MRRKKAIMEQAEFTMILQAVYIPKLIVKVLGTFPVYIIYTPNSVINSDTKLTEELFMLYENALGEALIIINIINK